MANSPLSSALTCSTVAITKAAARRLSRSKTGKLVADFAIRVVLSGHPPEPVLVAIIALRARFKTFRCIRLTPPYPYARFVKSAQPAGSRFGPTIAHQSAGGYFFGAR